MPRFSIIVPHYQGTISQEVFLRGVSCLLNQTYKSVEILCYHDGPLLHPKVHFPIAVRCTETRFNDYGHSLRDRGIREATGDYILHFSIDNILYPFALETIAKEIDRAPIIISNETNSPVDTNEMILFPVKMLGLQVFRGALVYTQDKSRGIIMTGHPPIYGNLDAMQLVVKREIWLKEGGWYDKRPDGDAHMYEAFCKKYGYRNVGEVLGEHR